MIKGKITRISGPIVYAEGLEKCKEWADRVIK